MQTTTTLEWVHFYCFREKKWWRYTTWYNLQ